MGEEKEQSIQNKEQSSKSEVEGAEEKGNQKTAF